MCNLIMFKTFHNTHPLTKNNWNTDTKLGNRPKKFNIIHCFLVGRHTHGLDTRLNLPDKFDKLINNENMTIFIVMYTIYFVYKQAFVFVL